jgi:ATP-binding cassette subfamily B multidrug efflux pump
LTSTIDELPDGFDTVVGEKGVILSGGQKQRVALARALLNDAPILVLDDPVSQVDTRTAARIGRTLTAFSGEKTLLIISHRLSARSPCRPNRGDGQGPHRHRRQPRALMAAGGYYARSYRLRRSKMRFDYGYDEEQRLGKPYDLKLLRRILPFAPSSFKLAYPSCW